MTWDLPERGVVYWPVANGDAVTVVIDPETLLQVDLNHRESFKDDSSPSVPAADRLLEVLDPDSPHLSAVAITPQPPVAGQLGPLLQPGVHRPARLCVEWHLPADVSLAIANADLTLARGDHHIVDIKVVQLGDPKPRVERQLTDRGITNGPLAFDRPQEGPLLVFGKRPGRHRGHLLAAHVGVDQTEMSDEVSGRGYSRLADGTAQGLDDAPAAPACQRPSRSPRRWPTEVPPRGV